MEEGGDLTSLRLDKLDSFSGCIRYFSLNGEMIFGNIFKKGRQVGHISIATDSVSTNSICTDSVSNEGGSANTRSYVYRCEQHLIEYETCFSTGYESPEGFVDAGMQCSTDYRWETVCSDVWIEDGGSSGGYQCPHCGSPNCGGYCQPTPPDGEGGTQPVLSAKAQAIKQKLDAKVQLGNIKNCVTIVEGVTSDGNLAEGKPNGSTLNDILYTNTSLTLTINSSLTETQLMIVMTHEYMHLQLFDISRNAGSRNELFAANKELYYDIVNSKVSDDWGKINDGHHQYMGSHIDSMGSLLRDVFPGQSADFYNYGRWGGGAANSEAFGKLSEEEQSKIQEYLRNNNL